MNTEVLFDPLFRLPFATGLVYAALLPSVGLYLRLRNEWLAALAYAQIASAGAIAAAMIGLPPYAGGVAAGLVGAGLNNAVGRPGDSGYALMMLSGWGIALLLLANVPAAERVGRALFDGQLYLTGTGELTAAVAIAAVAAIALRRLARALLLERCFPDFFRARGGGERIQRLVFDLVVAATLALAITSLGVMATFALAFVPPWVAFARAASWRMALVTAVGVGVAGYAVAFATALLADQPVGPVCALAMVFGGAAALALPRGRPAGSS